MFIAVKRTLSIYYKNRKMIFYLAVANLHRETTRATGGIVWVYIHDILYFSLFSILRVLLSGPQIDTGMSGLEYLLTGLVPWLLVSDVLNNAVNAIRKNKAIIKSIQFSVILLPGIELMTILIKRMPTFLFVFVAGIYYGHLGFFRPLTFIYYVLSMILFLFSVTLLLSSLTTLSEDFRQTYMAVMRVLFFSLPIMWSFQTLDSGGLMILSALLKLNPIVYIIQGFRDTFYYGYAQTMLYGAYFWLISIIMLFLGCVVQNKAQSYYVDFI